MPGTLAFIKYFEDLLGFQPRQVCLGPLFLLGFLKIC
jgi:hypothetical protein